MITALKLFFVCFTLVFSNISIALDQPDLAVIMQNAKRGHSLAQAKLGALYYLGKNVDLGPKARFKEKSRLKAAQYLLKDIEKDDKLAAEWFEKAAKQGLMEAELIMAALYDSGVGVGLNVSTAETWYKKAADHGSGTAKALTGKYKGKRLQASKDIPQTYALEILDKKINHK